VYFLFSVLTGAFIAIMIVANGELASTYGVYSSTAVIHLIGLIFVIVFYAFNKQPKQSKKRLPFYFYLGGLLGVGTVVFNSMAFGKISVSAILALGLLGQSVTAIIIDHFGWFKMPKVAFSKKKLIGLTFVFIGIFIMVALREAKKGMAITVALLTGLTVVISRTLNARLAQETSMMKSTLFNYIIGFGSAVVIMIVAGGRESMLNDFTLSSNVWIYTGGLIGVFAIMILNITVTKISSFYLTLLLFIGQVFSGIVIDVLLTESFSMNNLIGGILVTIGLTINVWLDKKTQNKSVNIKAKSYNSDYVVVKG